MAAPFALLTASTLLGSAWTGTAPGTASTGSGTINSGSGTYLDASAWATQVTLPQVVATLDVTSFGDAGFRRMIAGIKSLDVGLTFNQDLSASALHATINAIGIGGTFYIDAKATNASRSATNPSLVAQLLVSSYPIVTGQVGAVAQVQVTWQSTGWFGVLTS
jgi:hypothetical protein